MAQLIINIIFTASIYALISISFSITYNTTKFFNLSHAILITIGAYSLHFLLLINIPLFLSIILALTVCLFVQYLIFMLLLKPLIQKGGNSLTFLVATLGTYIVLQNIISLIFGDSSKVIRIGEVKQGIELFNGFITQIQVFSVIIIILIITSLYAVFMQTNFGKQLRCVSSNNNLSNIFGIDSLKVIKFSFLIGALLAGIVGILIGLDITLTPSMGFDYLLYGIICMIIGGTGSVRGAIPAAIIVSSSQHIGAFIFNYVWMEAIAYAILILFLLFRPLGFSGKQLKKVEI